MRKIFVASFIAILLWSCNDDDHQAFDKTLLASQLPECAYLEKEVAEKWIEAYRDCNEEGKCKEPDQIDFDYAKVKEIVTILRKAKLKVNNVSYESAVYLDPKPYACRLCGGDDSKPECQVTDHSTFLLKIQLEDSDDLYIDLVTICPPPLGCDLTRKPDAADSMNTPSVTDTSAQKSQ